MGRGRLDLQQATAMRYLIALAVPDMEPEQVAILDSVNGVLLKPGSGDPAIDAPHQFALLGTRRFLPLFLVQFLGAFNDQVYQYLVNGRTGKVRGDRPYSWVKITLTVLAVLVVLAIVFFLLVKFRVIKFR